MRCSDVLALTPCGFPDPSPAIAACRAGARGFLDIEFADEPAARSALRQLARFTSTPFGVRVGPEILAFLPALFQEHHERLAWILLAGGNHPDLAGWVERLRRHERQVWWEAVSLEEARRGHEWGADGLVLKGQEAGGRVGAETSFILLQRWQAHLRQGGGPALPVWVQGGVGLRTAAACLAGGATGVVLDAQLLLARESPLGEEARQRLAALDGSETVCLGERLGSAYRVFSRPGLAEVAEAAREEERLAAAPRPPRRRPAPGGRSSTVWPAAAATPGCGCSARTRPWPGRSPSASAPSPASSTPSSSTRRRT
jgi:NAD(P)H-dependent flavin oxidoreductase YrpB (nitropropane dioxygenase family)